jgi:tetratricopeptide (TPR) repeat protein
VAPAVPPPPQRPSETEAPLVTFKGGTEEGSGAHGLDLDDLFSDIGDLPRSTHAMSPVSLEEPSETKAASELVDLGRYEEALGAYDDQLKRNPTDRSARAGKELAFGLKLAAAGDRQGAIQHLEAALEIEPWSERTARSLNQIRRAQTDSRKGLLSKLLGRT